MFRTLRILFLTSIFLLPLQGAAAPASEPAPIVVGVMSFPKPLSSDMDFRPTLEAMRRFFAPRRVDVLYLPHDELKEAIRKAEIDFFFASSGFFWKMHPFGIKSIATVITPEKPEPNHGTAGVFVARKERTELKKLEDMEGLVLTANRPTGFHGFHVGMAEIERNGWNHEAFFARIRFAKETSKIVEDVLEGKTDVGLFRACWLEELEASSVPVFSKLRVIGAKPGPMHCLLSTRTYPNNTLGATVRVSSALAKEMTVALLTMPPAPRGQSWSVATDFEAVDQLYRLLKEGPYEHLKHITVRGLIEKFWPLLALIAGSLLVLLFKGWRAEKKAAKNSLALLRESRRRQKFQEEAARLSEKMDSLHKANLVGQLSGMFAHEMNQPLAVCSFYADGLEQLAKTGDLSPSVLQESLSEINRQIAKAKSIVEKVRSYAKNDPNRESRVNLSDIFAESVKAANGKAKGKTDFHFTGERGVFVKGDPLELTLLIWNLLKNAFEASQDSENPSVQAALKTKGGNAVIEIQNNGRILSSEEVSKLGKGLKKSSKEGGLGLGTSIAASIAEATGGSLKFTRLSSGGLKAEVILPRYRENK